MFHVSAYTKFSGQVITQLSYSLTIGDVVFWGLTNSTGDVCEVARLIAANFGAGR